MIARDEAVDLLVVGCGAGGLTVAQAFLEEAARDGGIPRVALLERAPRAERGGATRWSWVNLTVDQDGIVDPKVIARILASHPQVDEPYFRVIEREGAGTVAWLEEHGVQIVHERPPFAMANDYGAMVGGGASLVDAFCGLLEADPGVQILYDTEAVRLTTDETGQVDGVMVRGSDGLTRRLAADAVVLATGGLEGSLEAVTRYVGQRAGQIRHVVPGLRFNTGDGLRMATELGAATAGQFDRLHVQLVDERTTKPDAGIFGIPFGVIVDGHGRRFADEGSATPEALNAPLAWSVWRDHDATASFVFDARAARIPGWGFLNQTDLEPYRADTLAELAGLIGVDPEVFEEEIARFNAAVGEGDFDPGVLDGKRTHGLSVDKTNWALPIAEAPFFAYPLATASTFSYGGIRIDLQGRVVTPRGTAIPGLYAAGVATGVWYGEYPGAMSVLRTVTFARRTGAEIAAAMAAEAARLPG
ncbi:FAD-binding protein [Microbacterium azadirachtae]|uniref:Fumarate reductase flavoprotein subunit n=1 Tax=Microbacterium azadirachtae TaxID=582680 RepID=A0A0F0LPC7_9MICO|nr:FAD-binding protein [Microbacterium azadirachtae]KJL34544.1 Fumarate reductase flavoprotein subunit precursor [Microbacterium azadirachtae]